MNTYDASKAVKIGVSRTYSVQMFGVGVIDCRTVNDRATDRAELDGTRPTRGALPLLRSDSRQDNITTVIGIAGQAPLQLPSLDGTAPSAVLHCVLPGKRRVGELDEPNTRRHGLGPLGNRPEFSARRLFRLALLRLKGRFEVGVVKHVQGC